ncbi:DUF3943 domain-containing protein [Shewanella gaetbuli]|uniref:DUF3943 domain-containing protein n=1 Tax=Shewanella gaetbuli TaxID=220752 RepID=A0A9X1ZHY8_9GAMM|nr:DUF3943 domain-containing protein [Shewanella gaetbuli]MCL1141851.1 DUF3943 domain-containing protein [Shewanella gaetbuli]
MQTQGLCLRIGVGILLLSLPLAGQCQAEQPSSSTRNEHQHTTTELTSFSPAEKNWLGASLELSTWLILGTGLYSASSESMKDDFDYEIEGDAAKYFYQRLTSNDSWKYDDNALGMNWGHAYAGAIYHQSFRNNGFNYYESVAGTFVASTIWEVFAEYKEVVSINDQIVTTWGGAVLGESFYQLADMLHTKEGWLPTAFAWVFNPADTVKRWAGYGKDSRFDRSKSVDIFNLYTGVLHSQKTASDYSVTSMLLGMEARIDNRKGKTDGFVSTPSLVDMNMEAGISQNGIEDWQMHTQVWLGGYKGHSASNHLATDWAHSFYFGPSTAMEYTSLGTDADEDFYAVVNLLGLSAAANWHNQYINIEFKSDIFGDFSMVKPFATTDYLAQGRNFWGTKSVIWEGDYGYAWGHTFNLSFNINIDHVTFGMKLKSQRWDSLDDKDMERVALWNPNVNDLNFEDARDRYQIYIDYAFNSAISMSLHHEQLNQYGIIEGIDNPQIYSRYDDRQKRTWLRLAYRY